MEWQWLFSKLQKGWQFFFNALLKYQLCQKYFTDIQKNLFQAQQKIYIRYVKMKKLCKNYDNVKNNIFQFDLTSLWFSNYWRTSNQNICQISNTHTLNVPVQISFLEYINPKKKSYWIIKPLHQIYSLNNISKIVIFLPH